MSKRTTLEMDRLVLSWDAGGRGLRLVNGRAPVPGKGCAFGFGQPSSKRRMTVLDYRSRWVDQAAGEWEYMLYSMPCRWWMRVPLLRQVGWRHLIWRHRYQTKPTLPAIPAVPATKPLHRDRPITRPSLGPAPIRDLCILSPVGREHQQMLEGNW